MPICACRQVELTISNLLRIGVVASLTLDRIGNGRDFRTASELRFAACRTTALDYAGDKIPTRVSRLGAAHWRNCQGEAIVVLGLLGSDCDARDARGYFDPRVHLPGRSNLHVDYDRGALPATVVAGARKSRVTKRLHSFRSPQREQGFLPPRPLLALRAQSGDPIKILNSVARL